MLERLLPPSATIFETRRELAAPLFAEEERAVREAAESRRREFATARACAREALPRLGLPRQALPVGSRRAPEWPGGVVGSITHCDGYRAAAVAYAVELAALGIDAEPHEPLPNRVLSAIASPEEKCRLARCMREAPGIHWDRLLFSSKESAYKAISALSTSRVSLEDIRVTVEPRSDEFVVSSRFSEACASGQWLVDDGLILTAITVPAS